MTNCHNWYNRTNKPPRLNMDGGNKGQGFPLCVNITGQPS